MRISVDTNDPGYRDDVPLWGAKVYLDGVLLDACVTADEEHGLAICYDLSPEGKLRAADSGQPRRIHRYGRVHIDTRDESGVCTMCRAKAHESHAEHCPRFVREVVFGDPKASGGIVESAEGKRYLVGEGGLPFPAAVFTTEPLSGEACCDATAPCDKHRRTTTDADAVRINVNFETMERSWTPEVKFTAGEDLEAGEMIVQRADGKCYKAAPGEPGAFPFTPGGVGYAAIRIKASEALACPDCGTMNNLTHDEGCAFAAAFDDDGSEEDDTIDPAAMKEMLRTMPDLAPEMRLPRVLEHIPCDPLTVTGQVTMHITSEDFLRWFEPGPSTISKLLARRRKLIAKAKRASPDDAAVGSAIAAMNKPGRAHEL